MVLVVLQYATGIHSVYWMLNLMYEKPSTVVIMHTVIFRGNKVARIY